MVNAEDRFAQTERQRLRRLEAGQERVGQPRPARRRHRVQLRRRHLRLAQRLSCHRQEIAQMRARGQFRHHPAVLRVNGGPSATNRRAGFTLDIYKLSFHAFHFDRSRTITAALVFIARHPRFNGQESHSGGRLLVRFNIRQVFGCRFARRHGGSKQHWIERNLHIVLFHFGLHLRSRYPKKRLVSIRKLGCSSPLSLSLPATNAKKVKPKEGKAMIGRGMPGRGIALNDFHSIPLPIIPLPNLCARGRVEGAPPHSSRWGETPSNPDSISWEKVRVRRSKSHPTKSKEMKT
jgi:hypothetical protein